jgi:hypothetical protein
MQQQRRTERAFFETDRVRVIGDLTLPQSGYQSRFSDSLNRGDFGFVPLTEVEITDIESGRTEKRPFLLIAKQHVRLAYPIED